MNDSEQYAGHPSPIETIRDLQPGQAVEYHTLTVYHGPHGRSRGGVKQFTVSTYYCQEDQHTGPGLEARTVLESLYANPKVIDNETNPDWRMDAAVWNEEGQIVGIVLNHSASPAWFEGRPYPLLVEVGDHGVRITRAIPAGPVEPVRNEHGQEARRRLPNPERPAPPVRTRGSKRKAR